MINSGNKMLNDFIDKWINTGSTIIAMHPMLNSNYFYNFVILFLFLFKLKKETLTIIAMHPKQQIFRKHYCIFLSLNYFTFSMEVELLQVLWELK